MNRPATIWQVEKAMFGAAVWYRVCRTHRDGRRETVGNYYREKKEAQKLADELNREDNNE